MEFDEQLELGHFTLSERKCRVCGVMKDLIDGYYLVRKNKNIYKNLGYGYGYGYGYGDEYGLDDDEEYGDEEEEETYMRAA